MNRAGTARVRGWSVAALATALVASPPAAAQPQPAPPAGQSSPLPPPLRFDRIVPETDDLPAIYVTGVVQDSFGFMWFGTQENGLARFDGTTMKPFPVDPDNPNALPTRWITDLAAQGDGVVWIGTADGLVRYDGKTDAVTRFRAAPDNPAALSFDAIATLEVDRQGNLWAGVGDGRINLYEAFNRPIPALRPLRRRGLRADRHPGRRRWHHLGRHPGWWRVPPRPASRPRRGAPESRRPGRAGERRRAGAARGPRRAAVAGNHRGPVSPRRGWQPAPHRRRRRRGPDRPERHRAVRGQGRAAMVGTGNGLNQLDPSREPIVQYQVDPAAPAATGASPELVTRIMQDREGVIWIASQTGLRKVDPIRLQLAEYVLEANRGAPLAFAEAVTALYGLAPSSAACSASIRRRTAEARSRRSGWPGRRTSRRLPPASPRSISMPR